MWRNPFSRYKQASAASLKEEQSKATAMDKTLAAAKGRNDMMNETIAGERQWRLQEDDDDIDTDEEEPVKDLSWIHVPDDEELVGTKASNPRTSSCRQETSQSDTLICCIRNGPWPIKAGRGS